MTAPQLPDRAQRRPRRFEMVQVTRERPIEAQLAPSATTLTTLYTVPPGWRAKGSVLVCERGGAAATFRIAHRPDGDSIDNKHYMAYDRALPANSEDETIELWLDETDVISVYASSGDLSFAFNGVEVPKL